PNEIEDWPAEVRANVDGPFQINLWIPGPLRLCDRSQETRVREFLSRWGSPVPENTARPNDTDAIGCAKDWRCSADASLAGQSAALARAKPASDIITAVWTEAEAALAQDRY